MQTRETITLDAKAQQRLLVLTHVLAGELDIGEAAAYLRARGTWDTLIFDPSARSRAATASSSLTATGPSSSTSRGGSSSARSLTARSSRLRVTAAEATEVERANHDQAAA